MSDTTDIYLDNADDPALWRSLHRDATDLEKNAFTTAHAETIRQHYLKKERYISTAEAKDMAREIWWDIRVLGVDPTIGLHMPPNMLSRAIEG